MVFKVVPFTAGLTAGEGAAEAAAQLEALANSMEGVGWKFRSLESLETVITSPAIIGSNGCLGFGAVPTIPERKERVQVYAAVFEG